MKPHWYRDGEFEAEMSDLVGKVFTEVSASDDSLKLRCDEGVFLFQHDQDCCESVYIESITGDLSDLVGSPILRAEESTSNENPPDAKPETVEYQESFTWTFYKFATIKGYVDVRWYGSSNGYYSESVSISFTKAGADMTTPNQSPEHSDILKLIAHRARCFPMYPIGYHIPEVFAAIGEDPPDPEQPISPPAQSAQCVPDYVKYDPLSDELMIHGKRYSCVMFGPLGFGSDPGALLRIECGPDDVVTLSRVSAATPAPAPSVPQGKPSGREVLAQVIALCDDTENTTTFYGGSPGSEGFIRGRKFEAKGIRKAIGTWFQDQANAPAPAPAQEPAEVTLTDIAVDAAAKVLAEKFDYPWEHMPEEGRKTMRSHAEAVILSALCAKSAAPAVPQGWRKQRMANWPHSEPGMRLIGFVVPDDGQPLAMISERLAQIIESPAAPSQEPVTLTDERAICEILASIWFYGDWTAETGNEREIESLMRRLSLWPTTEGEIVNRSRSRAIIAALRAKEAS